VTRFHVSVSRTHFGRYRGRRVSFSYFALHDMFLAIPRAPGPIFMFCAPGLIFGGIEGAGSSFRRYQGCRVLFAYFALADSFSTEPRALGPICMFCAPKLIFDCIENARPRLHVLRFRTHFRRYRGRQVSFSCFVLQD
jgi:hypothetical protein